MDTVIVRGVDGLAQEEPIMENDVVILVDALRASNTVITLLSSGAEGIDVFSDLEDIRALNSAGRPYIYVGEQNADNIEGFDFNNSPSQILRSANKVRARNIAMITTNFAVELVKLDRVSCRKMVGSLMNAGALYHCCNSIKDIGSIYIIAAGRSGVSAPEDDITSEYIAGTLRETADIKFKKLENEYYQSASAANLTAKGFEEDIGLCLRIDMFDVIPEIKGRHIESI